MRDELLDLVAGTACLGCRRPGRLLCPGCCAGLQARPHPHRPVPSPPGLLPVLATGDYDSLLRDLVIAHKERGALGLAAPLGRLLAQGLLRVAEVEGLEGREGPSAPTPLTVVPVPSHPSVVRSRGHDPMLRIARRAAGELRLRGTRAEVRRLLCVAGRPRDQSGLGADERRRNLQGRFVVPDRLAGRGGVVVIVDDVMTTGATLREAQRALEDAGDEPVAAVTVAATRRRTGGAAGAVRPESPRTVPARFLRPATGGG